MVAYKCITIDQAYGYSIYDLVCDGDLKKVKFEPNEMYLETTNAEFKNYMRELKERVNDNKRDNK